MCARTTNDLAQAVPAFLPLLVWMIIVDSMQMRSRAVSARDRRDLGLKAFPYDWVIVLLGLAQLSLCALAGFFVGMGVPTMEQDFLTGGEMNISDLLVQFLALGGVAALIAVLVNLGKSFGLVSDGTADIWSTGLNLVGLLVLFVLKIVAPNISLPNVDKTAATIAQLLTLVLQLFFQFGVSKVAYASIRGVPVIGKSFTLGAKALIVGAVLALSVLAGLAFPVMASAAGPDYQYALVQCSGLSLAELQAAEQRFDTWYGWQKQLTTPAQWTGTYEARVNEFAASLGCPKMLDSGQLTFAAKLYVPVFRFYLGDKEAPY